MNIKKLQSIIIVIILLLHTIQFNAYAGTVVEDLSTQANAIYAVGMNLVSGNNPLDGTNLKFDETGITIKVPYFKYVKQL